MDYYSILGVAKNAESQDIKKAYRKLAAQHHPDRGGNADKFKQVQEAYDTLGDPAKRQQYDNPQPQFNFNSTHGFSQEDILNQMFRQKQRHNLKNPDITLAIDITLEDVQYGKSLIANYNLRTGQNQTVSIDVPPGARNGDTIRYSQLGEDYNRNLQRGDLYVKIRVRSHSVWTRDNDDLSRKIPVDIFTLLLGGKIKISTLDNKEIEINVPKGCKAGTVFSIGGYGLPNRSTRKKGNLYIKVDPIIPNIKDNTILEKIKVLKDEIDSQSK